jgi:hypothetical protein
VETLDKLIEFGSKMISHRACNAMVRKIGMLQGGLTETLGIEPAEPVPD